MKVRSLEGCWTCRLRRKKCDEEHPSCSTCVSLNLTCDGYGMTRPVWLDGGQLEKTQASKIKTIVKQTIKRRSMKRRSRIIAEPVSFPEVSTDDMALPSSSSSSEGGFRLRNIHYSPSGGTDFTSYWNPSCENILLGFDNEFSVPDTSTADLSPACPASENEALFSYWERVNTLTADEYKLQRPYVESTVDISSVNVEAVCKSTLPQGPGTASMDTEPLCDAGLKAYLRVPALGLSVDPVTDVSKDAMILEKTSKATTIVPSPISPERPYDHPSFRSKESSLLMHYLDRAIYKQFPFHDSSTGSGRGWLLALITGDQTTYYATLAFSHCHHTSGITARKMSLIERFYASEGVSYYVFALNQLQLKLREIQTQGQSGGIRGSIKTLACILQLLFLEISYDSSGDWSVHLQAANALLPELIQAWMKLPDAGSQDYKKQASPDEISLSADERFALEFLLSAFLWLDIHAHISARARFSQQVDYILVLEKGNVRLENLFGCKTWVLILILKISELDIWKKECEENQRLSVAELAKLGLQIEAALNHGLAGILAQTTCEDTLPGIPTTEDRSLQITKVFALAALTYLHVVVSGAQPDLPEIRDSVARSMDILEDLSRQDNLETVVWPACITGCMASKDRQDNFRRLVTVEGVPDNGGNLPRAIEIVELCWKDREAGLQNCEWSSVMKHQGQTVLLV